MINCAFPTFLEAVAPDSLRGRLVGFQANGSDLDHDRLERADAVIQVPVRQWADAMLAVRARFGVSLIGGCCGTGPAHLDALIDRLGEAG